MNKESIEMWNDVKESMESDPITLNSKESYTYRNCLQGYLHILARYKFAVKMLQNRKGIKVIDFGCNGGVGDLLIRQTCDAEKIIGLDFDHEAIAWANDNIADEILHFQEGDFFDIDIPEKGNYDATVSLDVIEHISQKDEKAYRDLLYESLNENGIAIVGTPNVTMYPYASPWNKKAHINNFDQARLYSLFSERFRNVFIFGMNDEVLNTGFYPFSCYIMALCCK